MIQWSWWFYYGSLIKYYYVGWIDIPTNYIEPTQLTIWHLTFIDTYYIYKFKSMYEIKCA